MLTRSKARALAAENTTVVVGASATGQGTHTRWKYPPGRILAAPSPVCSDSDLSLSSSIDSLSSGSSSSLSTLSTPPSSSSSISYDPFHTTSQLQTPVTPTRSTPRKLQRSPHHRWVQGSTHLIIEAPIAAPNMRESMVERKLEEVFNREWEIMMKARDSAMQAYAAYETDDETQGMDIDSDGESEFIRGDTEPVEDMDPISQAPHSLGPHGTEIIDHENFTPESSELPVYPEKWVHARKTLKWQPTEIYPDPKTL